MSRAPFTLRTGLVAGGGALVVAALVFGAGWLTANALEDDASASTTDGSQVSRPAVDLPASAMPGRQPAADIASGAPGAPAAAPAPDSISASLSEEDAARSMSGYGYGPAGLMFPPIGMPYTCPAPMPDVLNGTTVDVSQAGFDLTLLDDSFVLRSISVRAEGECGDNGQADSGVLAVDMNWLEIATGLDVYITQRVSEPVANVNANTSAQAYADGYAFSAFVNVYSVMPMDASGPPDDPRAAELLAKVMGQLAPNVPSICYYQQRAGTWDDVESLGIGDPRPAMPAGLTEQHSDFTVFDPPASECGGAPLESGGGFSASFADTTNSTFVSVSAYAIPQGAPGSYGYLADGNASWANDRYTFNVSGYGTDAPLGQDVIEAIALAMDPNFSAACLVTTRELDSGEAASLGFGQPTPPEGFEVVRSSMTVTEAPPASCGPVPDASYLPSYNLYWSMAGPDGATIDASAYRQPGMEPGAAGYISEGGISWTNADGTSYSVYGWTGTGPMDRETLVAVAESMDPALDVSSLQEGMGGPMPVDKPR